MRTTDVADASVAALAIRRQADIVTADRSDILRLLSAARSKLGIIDV